MLHIHQSKPFHVHWIACTKGEENACHKENKECEVQALNAFTMNVLWIKAISHFWGGNKNLVNSAHTKKLPHFLRQLLC